MISIFDSQTFNANLFFPRDDPSLGPRNSDDYYIDVTKDIKIHARRHPNSNA